MHLTKLEIEIIEHRLDVPDAMAEVLMAELPENTSISYEQAFNLYEERLPGLIAKLTANEPLDQWEVHAVWDVATDKTFVDAADDAINSHWKDGKEMTPQWAAKIFNCSEALSEKLLQHISLGFCTYCDKPVIDETAIGFLFGMADNGSYKIYHPACRTDIKKNLPLLDWKYDSEFTSKMGRNARTRYAAYRIEKAKDSSGVICYKVFIDGKIRATTNSNVEAIKLSEQTELAYREVNSNE